MIDQIDPNSEAVRELIASRAAAGLSKYGTDTTRQDISTEGWITHAQEEAADLCVYLQRLKSENIIPTPDQVNSRECLENMISAYREFQRQRAT